MDKECLLHSQIQSNMITSKYFHIIAYECIGMPCRVSKISRNLKCVSSIISSSTHFCVMHNNSEICIHFVSFPNFYSPIIKSLELVPATVFNGTFNDAPSVSPHHKKPHWKIYTYPLRRHCQQILRHRNEFRTSSNISWLAIKSC